MGHRGTAPIDFQQFIFGAMQSMTAISYAKRISCTTATKVSSFFSFYGRKRMGYLKKHGVHIFHVILCVSQ